VDNFSLEVWSDSFGYNACGTIAAIVAVALLSFLAAWGLNKWLKTVKKNSLDSGRAGCIRSRPLFVCGRRPPDLPAARAHRDPRAL
jgi:hypothetical protein